MVPLQVVFCMDTEGPCHDPDKLDLLKNWQEVDAAMDKIFAEDFRRQYADSFGGLFKMSWFFLSWTGFATNPRGRDFGDHKVRDHYLARWGKSLAQFGDEQCWHYHHPPASGVGNEWGLDWNTSREYENIISRQILERDFFPSCFRSGATLHTAESSRWVDTWFPVDYSNRAPLEIPGLVNWKNGVAEWKIYHPDPTEFHKPGSGRRYMARCLDLMTWVHSFSDDDIESAFERCANGQPAILACFEHDYRDVAGRVLDWIARIKKVSDKYPHVAWQFAGAVQAVQRYVQREHDQTPLCLDLYFQKDILAIHANQPIYQAIPWVVIKNRRGQIIPSHENVLRLDTQHWTVDLSAAEDWEEVAVAASTSLGLSAVGRIKRQDHQTLVTNFLSEPYTRHELKPNSIWEHSRLYAQSLVKRASGQAPEMDSVRQTVEILKPWLKSQMSVLDVGCGAGHAAISFAPFQVAYHGIDPFVRGIEIGRLFVEKSGYQKDALRTIMLEDLGAEEKFDAVICLNTLCYFPMFQQPLEIMARAAKQWLVIRSAFGEETQIRYCPDILLEDGFTHFRAYFNIYGRREVEQFLKQEGFSVAWLADRRTQEKFHGKPEVVGGISWPYEFLFAARERPLSPQDIVKASGFNQFQEEWQQRRLGGPTL